MKISLNWLKNYININASADEIADRLTLLGLEVEEVNTLGSNLDGVVIGKVTFVKPHPNADRLQICNVNIGQNEDLQIVCGASNVAKGQSVPVATVGTTLPIELGDGKLLKIKKSKIRGEVSMGMICAEDELGLGNNHDGIMVLDNSLQTGTPFSDVYKIHSDTVFEIAITPNRPDATCHIGVARDLAAYYNLPLIRPEVDDTTEVKLPISITIEDSEKCHRYAGRYIKNVTVKESPDWLKNYLKSIGLRPINNIVDATNFVLHETGQPLHAFDADLIANQEIIVKSFNRVVPFTTLDGVNRCVPADTLFICDGEKPVAIAGVMGGENSEISNQTKNVFLETAYFNPVSIRKASKLLSLQTDSSYRFERGIDPNITRFAANRCAELIAELGNGELMDGITDIHPVLTEPKTVTLRPDRLNTLLGTQLDSDLMCDILNRLEITAKMDSSGIITALVPTFRPDIEREIDLIEEIARVYDYNKITSPETTHFHTPSPFPIAEQFLKQMRRTLPTLGLREIYTNSLLPLSYKDHHTESTILVETLNPISKEQVILRDSLEHGFLMSVRHNLNRDQKRLTFFETGHIFKHSDKGTFIKGYLEERHLLIGIAGLKQPEHWSEPVKYFSFFDLKQMIYQWVISLKINGINHKSIKNDTLVYTYKNSVVGKAFIADKSLKSRYDIDYDIPVYWAEFNLNSLISLTADTSYKITPVPKFPAFEFDLALVVDKNVRAGELEHSLKESAGTLLKKTEIFDLYEGENIGVENKSIAFKLTFLDESKTLTIKEIEPVIDKILSNLGSRFSAKLRS